MNIYALTEEEVCDAIGAEHVGGPGAPDCRRGAMVVEVKDWRRPVHAGVIRSVVEKSWAQDRPLIVISTSGFTSGAIAAAAEHDDLWLYSFDADHQEVELVHSPDGGDVLDEDDDDDDDFDDDFDDDDDDDDDDDNDPSPWPVILKGAAALGGLALLGVIVDRHLRGKD